MKTIIIFLIYFALTSILQYWLDDNRDVVKKKGRWIYNKDFKAGETITVPIQCLMEAE